MGKVNLWLAYMRGLTGTSVIHWSADPGVCWVYHQQRFSWSSENTLLRRMWQNIPPPSVNGGRLPENQALNPSTPEGCCQLSLVWSAAAFGTQSWRGVKSFWLHWLCKAAGTETIYTDRCLQSTTVQKLSEAGLEAWDILLAPKLQREKMLERRSSLLASRS